MNIDKLIAKWDIQRKQDEERFRSLFPESDDLIAIVLRGQLMVEEYIDRLNRHCFHAPKYYDQAQLTFSKKLLIARAQVLVPHDNPIFFFDGLKKLNELRNTLAHNLDSPKLPNKVIDFLGLIEKSYSDKVNKEYSNKNYPLEERLCKAISYLLGQLSVVDHVVEFMEKSRHYGSDEQKNPADL